MIHVRLLRSFSASALALGLGLGIALAGAPVQAQIVETEPNSSCAAAQTLSTATFPVTVAGSLVTPPATPDVDFYRVTANPGDVLQIEQRGQASGSGTLSDPFVGAFTSSCGYLAYDDDGAGVGFDARVEVTVPADGTLVIAASSSFDWEFAGNGSSAGTYSLRISRVIMAEGITGRLVDADTGAGVPNALVWLQTCDNGQCWQYAGYTFGGTDGGFRFEPGTYTTYDNTLRAGEYRLIVDAGESYVFYEGSPFQLLEGQDLNLGDVTLRPVQMLGSIHGRLVDAVTGAALPGTAAPFGQVQLQTCSIFGCWTIRWADADAQGNFVFASSVDSPLRPGSYRIIASGDQYEATTSTEIEVGANQHYDLGDFRVKSFPVRIHLIQSCTSVPATGGDCPYVVRITNGNPSKLLGDAWSLVQSYSYYWNDTPGTEFQTGRKTISLQPGLSTDVAFSFTVPATLQTGMPICARAFTSHKTNQFEAIGSRDLFCIVKQGQTFQQVPDKEKREIMKQKGK